ncbi:transcription factor SPT20 homolog [Loxodonta africana]|uniref:transcription factor SPT20 homolog n=1 Tax=Loxodonta africana TaxID=9785 RepID=UPI0030D061E2
MQQSLEEALDHADCLSESAQLIPPKRKCLSSGTKSIFQKLHDLYVEECEKEPEDVQELRTNVNLLEKLVMRESLSCLVVNLYPGNEGYSLMLSREDGPESETIHLPYEERELLEYLDAEELPPILNDLLEKCQVNIFYSGCVIAEIRDYRQCSNRQPPGYQSRHVLLRPTMQTVACDVTNDSHKWTQEDNLVLKSQLILATAEPLHPEPPVAVACTANRLLYNNQKMNTHPMKQCLKRSSRCSLNQPLEQSDCQPPPQLRSSTSCQKNEERKEGDQYDLKISEAGNCMDTWKQSPCNPAMPSEVDVNDDYLFDCEAGDQYQKTALSVMQSLNDPLFSETIQPCEEDEESYSEMSPFHFSIDDYSDWLMIGLEAAAEKIVIQYQDLVKKECPVRMPHSSSGSASLSLSSRKEIEQCQRVLVQSSVLGKEVKHPPPRIKFPSSSGSRSLVNYSPPQQANRFLKSPMPSVSEPSVHSQESFMDFSRVSMLSPEATSSASSSQRITTIPVMVKRARLNSTNAMSSVCGAQASVSGSGPMLDCIPGAKTPAEINLSSCLPSGVLPTAVPSTMKIAPQAGIPLILENTSTTRPLTLFHLPGTQLIFVPQQQQQLSQRTPEQPPHHSTACPQHPRGQGSAQGSTSQAQALPTQQAALINLTELEHLVPSQAGVLSQLASAQKRPEQSHPHQRVQIPAALPQQQPQIQQSKISQRSVSVAEAATQTVNSRRHRRISSHSKGQSTGARSKTPEALRTAARKAATANQRRASTAPRPERPRSLAHCVRAKAGSAPGAGSGEAASGRPRPRAGAAAAPAVPRPRRRPGCAPGGRA